MAHAMAMVTDRVKADVVEVQEFPHLAQAYKVQAVPKTVINNRVEVLGAVPEGMLLQRVLVAAGREDLMQIIVDAIKAEEEKQGGQSPS
jgi:predicted DsbA family dithiol-disulfide isomerase